ncbi:hypothetical protein Hanom_Chr11g00978701 [Helianthus anomalus]
MATSATPSSAGGAVFTRGDTSTTTEVTSPTHLTKKPKFVSPTLIAFEAVQAAYALPFGMYFSYECLLLIMNFVLLKLVFGIGITSGAEEGVTSTFLPSVGVALPTGGSGSLPELISQAGVTSVASCVMPPPMLTVDVTITASPIFTSLTFNVLLLRCLILRLAYFLPPKRRCQSYPLLKRRLALEVMLPAMLGGPVVA